MLEPKESVELATPSPIAESAYSSSSASRTAGTRTMDSLVGEEGSAIVTMQLRNDDENEKQH